MIDLPAQPLEVLVKIYIGQNIRDEGILQSEIREKDQVAVLLSKDLILENHWYLDQFRTTERGSEIAGAVVRRRIIENRELLKAKVSEIPKRILGFFVRRYVSKNLNFSTLKPFISFYASSWEDSILCDSRIWILWDKFFTALESCGLCVKTYNYVSTRGGERRGVHYVISRETGEFLMDLFSKRDFTADQENTIKLHPVLRKLERILSNNDIDLVRQQFYQLLKEVSVSEEQLAGIVDAMSKIGITSEYRGLLSDRKPFEISDAGRFQVYLDKNLLEPAVGILLRDEGEIQTFTSDKKIQNFDEEMCRFYTMVSSFERQLREFIKEKLGDGWNKRIENDFPNVIKDWRDKKGKDENFGIEPEKELINYADLAHYVQIIEEYDRLFTDGKEDLERVKVKLTDWGNYGRNPIMHSRTVDQQKIATTRSAVKFLEAWMRRKTKPEM
jgi:hypothetical protein